MQTVLVFTCALLLGTSPTEKVPPTIGAAVRECSLADVNGKRYSLHGSKDSKAVVVVFIGTECPIANLYIPTLAELHKKYASAGVQFLAINSNDQDSLDAVIAHARERHTPFPVLKDVGHKAADALGGRRTPEAFVLDSHHVIRYRGRIDDQYGYTYRRPAPTKTELKDAIDAVLAGKPVAVPETEVLGCVIGRDKK